LRTRSSGEVASQAKAFTPEIIAAAATLTISYASSDLAVGPDQRLVQCEAANVGFIGRPNDVAPLLRLGSRGNASRLFSAA
jgi:hypothetical protein